MAAWINGTLGVLASFWIGTSILGLDGMEVLRCIGASLFSGMLALVLTLKAEKTPWVRTRLLNRSLKTWVVFLSIYVAGLLLLAPPLRDPRVLRWMVFPLILATGFTILAFGPLQDRWVAQAQRKSRS